MVEEGDVGGSGEEVVFLSSKRANMIEYRCCFLISFFPLFLIFGFCSFDSCRGLYQRIHGGTGKGLLSGVFVLVLSPMMVRK